MAKQKGAFKTLYIAPIAVVIVAALLIGFSYSPEVSTTTSTADTASGTSGAMETGDGHDGSMEGEMVKEVEETIEVSSSGATGAMTVKTSENFRLLVSDAPADIDDFDSLVVDFSKARIFKENSSFEEFPVENESVDLTQLIGELAVPILEVNLTEGTYTKIELHVADVDGIVNNESVEVKVPSNKLMITNTFTISNNDTTTFVFDINVVKRGNQDSYNLLPVISESGVVGDDLGEDDVDEINPPGNQTDNGGNQTSDGNQTSQSSGTGVGLGVTDEVEVCVTNTTTNETTCV